MQEPLYPFCLLQLTFKDIPLSSGEIIPGFTTFAQIDHVNDRKTGEVCVCVGTSLHGSLRVAGHRAKAAAAAAGEGCRVRGVYDFLIWWACRGVGRLAFYLRIVV